MLIFILRVIALGHNVLIWRGTKIQYYSIYILSRSKIQLYCNILFLRDEVLAMLNQRIRLLRQSRNMSQVNLAKRLGVTKQSISNWENDNIQPSIEMLMKLAAVFAVSTDYLLGLNSGQYLDVDGLPPEVVAHLRQLVEDLRRD